MCRPRDDQIAQGLKKPIRIVALQVNVHFVAQRQGARVVNDPQGLRDFNEKLAALLFPQCCPPTLVSRDAAALKAFVLEHGQVVGRLVYERMQARPKQLYGAGIASNYQGQGLKLAKQFKLG